MLLQYKKKPFNDRSAKNSYSFCSGTNSSSNNVIGGVGEGYGGARDGIKDGA
jgi:hypothetical protein